MSAEKIEKYSIREHRHRFAVWAAGRAYSRGGKESGFTVANARTMLVKAGLREIHGIDDLPNPADLDDSIDTLINNVMAAGGEIGLNCTYGRAQKLVNIYIKSKIVCGETQGDERVNRLHPPLDDKLLKEIDRLARSQNKAPEDFREKWNTARDKGTAWTQFDKPTYDAYIDAIKILQGADPLWAVEEHWMK